MIFIVLPPMYRLPRGSRRQPWQGRRFATSQGKDRRWRWSCSYPTLLWRRHFHQVRRTMPCYWHQMPYPPRCFPHPKLQWFEACHLFQQQPRSSKDLGWSRTHQGRRRCGQGIRYQLDYRIYPQVQRSRHQWFPYLYLQPWAKLSHHSWTPQACSWIGEHQASPMESCLDQQACQGERSPDLLEEPYQELYPAHWILGWISQRSMGWLSLSR